MRAKDLDFEDISRNDRKNLGGAIPVEVYRMLRVLGMNRLFGESTGYTLYLVGKELGHELGTDTLDDFAALLERLRIGIPLVEKEGTDEVRIMLKECMTCSGINGLEEMICDFEAGLIAGALERIYARPARTTQTSSSALGSNGCRFRTVFY